MLFADLNSSFFSAIMMFFLYYGWKQPSLNKRTIE